MRDMRSAALLGWLAAVVSPTLCAEGAFDFQHVQDTTRSSSQESPSQRLAVVVPAFRGDLSRAVASLERWPTTCSQVTLQSVDLVLYYAEGEEDSAAVTAAADTISKTAGHCFSKTRTVYAHLGEEEDVYPKGPSVMFYKMFLDEEVSSNLSEYDALAIIEWDVLVATDRSFEELYRSAFHGTEQFWVKGSNVGGTTFHTSADVKEMWHVLGHINGNAIYNNNDRAFVEYVEYTRTRWDFKYPYDVALWLTISDFPYSWPLWQRYSSKFITTNLISYVGHEHVDHNTVSDAIAGQTLFIHGSRVDDGNMATIKATMANTDRHPYNTARQNTRFRATKHQAQSQPACFSACSGGDTSGLPAGVSTVCDDTCDGVDVRFGGFGCGAGDAERFGAMCRLCYVDVELAREAEQKLALRSGGGSEGGEVQHVIMCDTMRPPEALECSDKCARKKDTVCDDSCGTGRYGDYNCNWRDRGSKCRFCFEDLDAALVADDVAKRRGGRVIMCSTLEPPHVGDANSAISFATTPKTRVSRKLQRWREEEKWRGDEDNDEVPKWQTGPDDENTPKWQRTRKWRNGDAEDDDVPKWQQQEKWKGDADNDEEPKWTNNVCRTGCIYTSNDGTRGRVCDSTCLDGDPYGTNGCAAKDGLYGNYCRICYNDNDKALKQDDATNRAIMCETLEPVDVYARRLSKTSNESAPRVARKLRAWKDSRAAAAEAEADAAADNRGARRGGNRRRLQTWRDTAKWQDEEKWRGDEDNDEVPKWQNGPDDENTPKWKRTRKWRGGDTEDEDEVPKWQQQEKWKGDADNDEEPKWTNNVCRTGCTYTSNDGTRGRVCDSSCSDGDPYGTNGCNAKDGLYGTYCRLCYNDDDKANKQDSPSNRAIMCDTLLPVTAYTRRLSNSDGESASRVRRKLQARKQEMEEEQRRQHTDEMSVEAPPGTDLLQIGSSEETVTLPAAESQHGSDNAVSFFAAAAERPFTDHVARGNLCAFVAGRADEVEQWEVAVTSILLFVPGMRIAVAAEADGVDAYQRAVGGYPGVRVSRTENAFTASLFADNFCGEGTELIYYVSPGSVVSRTFTSKDTHSPRGELLVVYSDSRGSYRDTELARYTTAVLGFQSPSFTYGTDLMLPVGANADLRELLVGSDLDARGVGEEDEAALAAIEELGRFDDISAVPQVMAALAYSRNTRGVWFLNPQAWVTQHLFKTASIWDIPLVKPRYTCAINSALLRSHERPANVAEVLQTNLDFYSRGGTCENGLIDLDPEEE